jgi:homotetrameric cytidine deaminase
MSNTKWVIQSLKVVKLVRSEVVMENLPPTVEKCFQQAQQALTRAYAPYSKLQVATALKLSGVETPVVGVNVENASYGGTICAERSAVVSAISQFGKTEIEHLVIISSLQVGTIPPCGLCLQVLREFVTDDCPIYLGHSAAITTQHLFKEFLPLSFSAAQLPDNPHAN